MLDINLIKTNPEYVKNALAKKGWEVDFTELLAKVEKRVELLKKIENVKAEANKLSNSVPMVKKAGGDIQTIFAQVKALNAGIKEDEATLKELENEINEFVCSLPNLPDNDLVGGFKENNAVIYTFGNKPEFDFKAKDHVELCESLGLIDYERGAKISGHGTWIYTGLGAQLEWALINFFISEHLKDGYTMIMPPHLLNYESGYTAGQFPKFADEVYWLDCDEDRKKNRFMLPTAETALVNLYAGEIIDNDKLPMKFFAYTPCYRKEAGSYRAEERGMIRGHQFNKVEMVQYTTKEGSDKAFEELVEKIVVTTSTTERILVIIDFFIVHFSLFLRY